MYFMNRHLKEIKTAGPKTRNLKACRDLVFNKSALKLYINGYQKCLMYKHKQE